MKTIYIMQIKECRKVGVNKAETPEPPGNDCELVSVVAVGDSFRFYWKVYIEEEVNNGYYRDLAAKQYQDRNYTNDPVTLALGVNEEAGELGKAVNWYHNPKYIRNEKKLESPPDNVEHEIKDTLIYLAALANALNLNIKF
jgi:NTP pyrophosphatase (non-canonical NTP hydrolase)